MDDINLGLTISRERQRAGVTQEQLAAHLNVTKAAVSKWELGQSLPDVAQLPRLAAYFGLTLDELMDYRPQLSEEEIGCVSIELMRLFEADPAAANRRFDELVAEYYSCWPFLLQAAALLMRRVMAEPNRAEEFAERAEGLLLRVEGRSCDVGLVRRARFMRAPVRQMLGDVAGGIALLEELREPTPLPVDASLADFYELQGEDDKGLRMRQAVLYRALSDALGSVGSQLAAARGEARRTEPLLAVGDALADALSRVGEIPVAVASYRFLAATARLEMGDTASAARYLEQLVTAGEPLSPSADGLTALFDAIPDIARPVASDEATEMFFAPFSFAELIAPQLQAHPAWQRHRDDPAIAPWVARLESL